MFNREIMRHDLAEGFGFISPKVFESSLKSISNLMKINKKILSLGLKAEKFCASASTLQTEIILNQAHTNDF